MVGWYVRRLQRYGYPKVWLNMLQASFVRKLKSCCGGYVLAGVLFIEGVGLKYAHNSNGHVLTSCGKCVLRHKRVGEYSQARSDSMFPRRCLSKGSGDEIPVLGGRDAHRIRLLSGAIERPRQQFLILGNR
jgi:hypothetical protein